MFATTQMPALNLAFPDVCLTPMPAPVPVPYPNIATSATGVPAAYTVLIVCMPAHNLLTTIMISVGDTPGVAMGVVSHTVMFTSRNVTAAFTVLSWGIPTNRMCSITIANLYNCPGATVTPSQIKVLILAP